MLFKVLFTEILIMAVSMPKKRYVFVVMLLIDFDD